MLVQPRSPQRAALGLTLLGLLLAMPPLGAQEDPEDPGLFGEVVDVRVVNLEVVVEQKGERVHGLGAEDFVLEVDGEPMPIEFFSEVRGGAGVASEPSARDATVPALPAGETVPNHFLVFVDDVFTLTPYRNRVLKQLREDLPRLGPDDRMAVVAFDGDSIELLNTWSRSERELKSALREAERRPTQGLRQRVQEQFDRDLSYRSGFGRFDSLNRTGTRGTRSYYEMQEVVSAASSTLRAFAQPEGRKVLILISGNWPTVGYSSGFEPFVSYSGVDGRRFFAPLVDTANLLGYTVYPVDAAETSNRFADASYGSLREARFAEQVSRDQEWTQEGYLVTIADQTGGRALLDGAASDVLSKVQEDTSSYYWLGFTPDWRANDARHRLEVKVPGLKRAKVRLRESFSDLSARTETTLRLESAQLFDLPVATAGTLVVKPGEPTDAGWRKVVLPLAVEIPLDQVTHLPTPEGWAAQVEIRVAVTDDRGDRADIPVIPLVLKREERPRPGDKEIYVAHLKMRERPHRLLVSVFDPASGEELSTRLEVDPGKL